MIRALPLRYWLFAMAALAIVAVWAMMPAQAHHGWSWAEAEQSRLTGKIEKISMAPPHPVLHVKTADGVLWQIDLGNPSQTERSGFTGTTAKVGDNISILGNRSLDKAKMHMKAVRITLGDKNYDMYPERLKAN